MNLEFLQALVSIHEDNQNIIRNGFQEEYASAFDALARVEEKREKDLENNAEYQRLLNAPSSNLQSSEARKQELRRQLDIMNATDRKNHWHKKHNAYLVAKWRLLVIYGEYVTSLPECPKEIQDLFKPVQFKRMLGQPLADQLVSLAMQTQWSIE